MDILSMKEFILNCGNANEINGCNPVNTTKKSDENVDFSMVLSSFSTTRTSNTSMSNVRDDYAFHVDKNGMDRLNIKKQDVSNDKVNAKDKLKTEELEKIDEFKEEVVAVISEITGMDAKTVEEIMEDLALTLGDLLNPQTLADLVATITGESDIAALLMNGEFGNLMEQITDLTKQLSDALNLSGIDLREVLSQFAFEEPVEFSKELAQQLDLSMEQENETMISTASEETVAISPLEADTEDNITAVDHKSRDMASADLNTEAKSQENIESEDEAELKLNVEFKDADVKEKEADDSNGQPAFEQESGLKGKHEEAHVAITAQDNSSASNMVNSFSEVAAYVESYTSVNPAEILEQITSNLKVNLLNDATTIEMQLNPENLGKVFLQISAKEGAVSAQFTASNEVVKEVLEAQMATLRENLNHQGVKVDAIEVTVSSHGFERNLDDNQHREEKEGEMLEANKQTRRSLRMDSLDELVGLMSEEEMLAAQIMRDNGNSMDLTA